MPLNSAITALALQNGCPLVGFADLRCLPVASRCNLDYGIVFALPFSQEAIRENKNDRPQQYNDEHTPQNQIFKTLKTQTADFLRAKGYEAVIDTPAAVIEDETLRAQLSQKAVATLAGIGWIGKNAMLVTPQFGAAVRMTVVLTDAPLECGTPITQSRCPPQCTICADVCPGNAIKGGLWAVGVDRDEFFDAHACRDACTARSKRLLDLNQNLCGLCIAHCPCTRI